MSVYTVRGTKTTAAQTALVVIGTSTVRPRVQRIKGSNVGAVTLDSQIQLQVSRITTAGTTTAVTPAGTDPNDPTATFLAGSNATVEPTYTANTLLTDLSFNPRGMDIWQAYDRAAEIIIPATANSGIGVLLVTLGGGVTVAAEATVQQ